MLKILFDRYKWYAIGFLFLAYSIGVWNVSTTYTSASWNARELERTERFMAVEAGNAKLAKELSKQLQEALVEQRESNRKFTLELIDEMAKDPRYKSCTTTDGVRAALKRKLDSQPK